MEHSTNMNQTEINFDHFQLHACLPFVELADQARVQLGPVLFWPASKSHEFLNERENATFKEYMEAIREIRANGTDSSIATGTLNLQQTTCISIDKSIPVQSREFVLIDALYLLYFACSFRNLYYGNEVPSFHSFRKLIPASVDFIEDKTQWHSLHINEVDREQTICIHLIDQELCNALGEALHSSYLLVEQTAQVQYYKRLVRAIRYVVDRFFQRFTNLFVQGLHFSDQIFKPEDFIFLASAFETLFNINEKQAASDFKYKLRQLLQLKYDKQLELFWKWVDDFYAVKQKLTCGDTFIDPIFRFNPNFEISHILLGIKVFIYSVCTSLAKHHLIVPIHEDAYTPPDFRWIHPDELLLFFWSETNILHKLNLFIKQLINEDYQEELDADVHFLTHLFVYIYDNYYPNYEVRGIRFIPASQADFAADGRHIIERCRQQQQLDPDCKLLKIIHPSFLEVLEKRLNTTH